MDRERGVERERGWRERIEKDEWEWMERGMGKEGLEWMEEG